jgi:type II secretory ATPase GspE/PulE/Tfp pilus assembly ATPase PilB-like protein
MPRFAMLLLGAAAVWLLDPQWLLAQDAAEWPQYDLTPPWRGPGYYLSIWKIASCWILFAGWVHTTDWVNQDCQRNRLDYVLWNCVVFFPFLAAFVLVWLLPWFWLSYFLLLAAYVAPLTVFILQRNKQVDFGDRVMTKAHLRRWVSTKAALLGMKVAAEDAGIDGQGPPITFKPQGGATERDDNVNLLTARQNPGYNPARQVVHDALTHRADSVMLDYGAQIVTVRHQIDGVWHNQEPIDRMQLGDPLLVVLKTLAALKPAERRAKQEGVIGVETPTAKYTCKIATQGTQGGERVVLQFEGKKLTFKSLEELGMRPKMLEQLDQILAQKKGFFVVSAMPGGGLSTTFDVVLNSTDRFMRNFAAVDEVTSRERDILNVPRTTFDAAAGESPATILPKLIRTYPDVLVVRDMVDLETLKILTEQVAKEERMAITTVRAKEAVEALLRVLLFKISPAEFAAVASGVLNVRPVRKLCETCKEAYPPPSEVLKQMGLPPGRIEHFYRPPTVPIDPKHPEKVCEVCQGIGYQGRTGIFELLVVDDRLRAVLGSQPKLDLLRDAARKSKHRTLQDEGLLLVAKGITSLQELLRVLKQ